jgi:hypothetical protein
MPRRPYTLPEPLDPLTDRPTSDPHRFIPRFCPWPECPAHTDFARFAYRKHGFFKRLAPPFRIPRFRCLVCRRTCSTQSFSTTYYLKRPELLVAVAQQDANAQSDRDVRRSISGNPQYAPHIDVGAAGSTVTRLLPRLGRHAALALADFNGRARISEPLVGDDFETFCVLQLHGVALATIVGRQSAWVHMCDLAPHRRGGPRTPAQLRVERRLAEQGLLPDPAERERAWTRALGAVLARAEGPIDLATDDAKVIAEVVQQPPFAGRIRHRTCRNPKRGPKGSPPSAEARARDRALFEADQLHRRFRQAQAHDRRETTAFSRNLNALFARHLLYVLGRCVVQPRRERRRHEGTPAMRLGLLPRPLSWSELLERRRFLAHTPELPPGWAEAYFERLTTLGRPSSPRRLPRCHRA